MEIKNKKANFDYYIEDIPELVKIEEVKEEHEEKRNNNIFYFFVGFITFFIIGYELKKRS